MSTSASTGIAKQRACDWGPLGIVCLADPLCMRLVQLCSAGTAHGWQVQPEGGLLQVRLAYAA